MPVVNKQQARPSPPKTTTPIKTGSGNGVLSRIGPVKKSNIGSLRVSVYGQPKTGKTRFACTFPKPLLVIGAEDGTASVVGTQGVDFVQLETTDEAWEVIDGPIVGGKYKTVVLDQATKFREMRIVELFAAMNMEVPERKPFLYADKVWKGVWTQCSADLRKLLGRMLDLPRVTPMNVIIIAQEANLFQEEGTAAQSEIIKPRIASAVGKATADFINAECDYVCQTLKKEKMAEVEVAVPAVGNKPAGRVKQLERVGTEYAMRIGPHDLYYTGFRRSIDIKTALPDFIVDPTYDKIVEVINGTYKV